MKNAVNFAVVINKDTGYTSRDVVNKLNKILNTKAIGHTGTLDPLAEGVLVCLVNKYTKLVPLITNEEKEYVAEIKLGLLTDTLDITGKIIKQGEIPRLDKSQITEVLNSFLGSYKEKIPLYSAVHVDGKRLYEYAREGKSVVLPERMVEIKEISLLDYHDDIIKICAVVSKGTYIRSLIQSICEKLNTIGVMNKLTRTRQGIFKIENSYTLEEIVKGEYKPLFLKDLLNVKTMELSSILEKKVINGNIIELNEDGYILFVQEQKDIALYYFKDKIGKLLILF